MCWLFQTLASGHRCNWSLFCLGRAQSPRGRALCPLLLTTCSTSPFSPSDLVLKRKPRRGRLHQQALLLIRRDWQAARLIQQSQPCIKRPLERFCALASVHPASEHMWHPDVAPGMDAVRHVHDCEVKHSARTQWLKHWHSHIPHVRPSRDSRVRCSSFRRKGNVDMREDGCPTFFQHSFELENYTFFKTTDIMSCNHTVQVIMSVFASPPGLTNVIIRKPPLAMGN